MEASKRAAFVKRMGRKRLSLARGGVVRKHYDLGGLTGTSGGAGGTGFGITPGTNGQQINNAYNNAQLGLVNQDILTGALIPQNQKAIDAQNTLSGQFANQAAGNGPNVATNVLNQATGANVANEAALMAGQRGAGSNPGLIAREAAMTGANVQQQAAGQAATTQAQQQIAAEQAQAQLSANQIAQSQGSVSAENQAGQGEQGILEGANTAANNVQGQLANTQLQGQQGLIGGVLNGVGGAVGSIFEEGGEVIGNPAAHKKLEFVHKMTKLGLDHHDKTPMMADGGSVPNSSPSQGSSGSGYFGAPKAGANADVPLDPVKAKAAQDSMRSAFGYAEGGLAVPTVNVQTPQGGYAPIQEVQGGFTPTNNAGAEALSKGSQKIVNNPNKPQPMAQMNAAIPAQAQSVLGVNPQVIGPIGSTDMMAPDKSTLGTAMAAHGGVMHPHFQGPHKSHIANYLMNKGGPVPALVSAGEVYLNPEQVHSVIHDDVDPAKIGHKFKGKAKIKGDSLKNDSIPATLETGGVVVDRENMSSPEKRKLFVHRAVAKAKAGRK